MLRRSSIPVAVAFVLALTACGSDDEPAPPPTVERRTETPQELPKLQRGYEKVVNRASGLVFARPPGWKATRRGPASQLTAPDQLVVMSLTADRSDGALSADPRDLAPQTFAALKGYKGELDPRKPRRFKQRYDAWQAEGRGVARSTKVPQRLRVVVLEREGVAVVTAVIAENAKEEAPDEVRQALETLRTLRTRPVRQPRSGRSG